MYFHMAALITFPLGAFSIDASCEREEKKIFFPVSKEQDLFADCSERVHS